MPPIIIHLITYFGAFALVWFGAGLTLNSVIAFARSWRLPEFLTSFFLLGLLTSLPEATIGGLSVLQGRPSLFVGNLLGAMLVLFLVIIPLLALVSNGVKVPRQFNKQELIVTLLVAVTPAFLTADQRITPAEGWFLVATYISLFVFLTLEQSVLQKVKSKISQKRHSFGLKHLAHLLIGVVLLVAASQQIVTSTLFFANLFSISPFFIGLVVVAFGTNMPELSIVVRAAISKKSSVALADYLGSACANTLLFGVFAALYGKPIDLPNHFLQRTLFITVGLVLFFLFARSKSSISRRESLALLAVYLVFIAFEVFFVAV